MEGLAVQWERDHQRCADELAATKRSLETAQTESSTLARQLKVTQHIQLQINILAVHPVHPPSLL